MAIKIVLSVLLGLCWGAFGVQQGNVTTINRLNNTSSRTGVCVLEVPTIDLLADEDKIGFVPSGNGSRPGYSKIEICCVGYQRPSHSFRGCEPICDDGCDNGNCTAPNVCTCKNGYVKDNKQRCVPTCPIGCPNGRCVNRRCSCNSGYRPDESGRVCLPHCSDGCGVGGTCVAPETCDCRPGFYKNKGTCEYFCEGGCHGGTCIGPNQCSCKPGYIRKGGSCAPACPRGCENGVCSAPDKCTCRPGFEIDQSGTKCEARCDQPCLNGFCSGPNQCTCREGYIKDNSDRSGTRCVAHCPDGCENGQCSGPNFCICNAGYVKESKGSNRCVKRQRRAVRGLHYELLPEQH